MKLKRFTSAIVAASICLAPIARIQRANSNPAIIAPIAFCAGTAGVGCVLVGTAIVGGVIYCVWQNSEGKRVHANSYGEHDKLIMEDDLTEYECEVVLKGKWTRNKPPMNTDLGECEYKVDNRDHSYDDYEQGQLRK